MRVRLASTVLTLMYKVAAISGLLCPAATRSAMRRSVGVRALSGPGARRARCAWASACHRWAPRVAKTAAASSRVAAASRRCRALRCAVPRARRQRPSSNGSPRSRASGMTAATAVHGRGGVALREPQGGFGAAGGDPRPWVIQPPRRFLQPGQPAGGAVQLAGGGPGLDQIGGEGDGAWLADPALLQHVRDRLQPAQRRRRVIGRQLGQAQHRPALSGEAPVRLGFGLGHSGGGELAGALEVAAARLDERVKIGVCFLLAVAGLPVPLGTARRRARPRYPSCPRATPPPRDGALDGFGALR